jgi:hypothetical protein
MTETRATAPVFPPGRYGRRREGRRSWTPVLLCAVMIAASVLVGIRLYQRYGDPTYTAQVIRNSTPTDTQVVVEFDVRVPAGGAAICVLRARAYDGREVGRREVTVQAKPGASRADASEAVPTTARAFVGEVVRCRAPG